MQISVTLPFRKVLHHLRQLHCVLTSYCYFLWRTCNMSAFFSVLCIQMRRCWLCSAWVALVRSSPYGPLMAYSIVVGHFSFAVKCVHQYYKRRSGRMDGRADQSNTGKHVCSRRRARDVRRRRVTSFALRWGWDEKRQQASECGCHEGCDDGDKLSDLTRIVSRVTSLGRRTADVWRFSTLKLLICHSNFFLTAIA